jgi:hypothetical protein
VLGDFDDLAMCGVRDGWLATAQTGWFWEIFQINKQLAGDQLALVMAEQRSRKTGIVQIELKSLGVDADAPMHVWSMTARPAIAMWP